MRTVLLALALLLGCATAARESRGAYVTVRNQAWSQATVRVTCNGSPIGPHIRVAALKTGGRFVRGLDQCRSVSAVAWLLGSRGHYVRPLGSLTMMADHTVHLELRHRSDVMFAWLEPAP